MPPSIHESGQQYTWLSEPLHLGGIAEIPKVFLDGVIARQRKTSPRPSIKPRGQSLDSYLADLRGAPVGQRNNALFGASLTVSCPVKLGRIGKSVAQRRLLDTALSIGLPEQQSLTTIQQGFKNNKPTRYFPAASNDDEEQADTPKPVVIIERGGLSKCVHESVCVLKDARLNIYNHGGRLVRLTTHTQDGIRPTELKMDATRVLLSDNATFIKYRNDKDGNVEEVPCNPPIDVAKSVLELGLNLFDELQGTIACPFIYDGEFVTEKGFHKATGWFVNHNLDCNLTTQLVSRETAFAALGTLRELFADFPFENETAESVGIAALLSGIMRATINGCCPMFIFDSPTPGSGKSTLVDVASILVTGDPAPKQVYQAGPELRKSLFAHFLNQVPVLCFDNISKPLGGDALDSVLTARTITDRVLCRSETSSVPNHCVLFATGNNITIKGDLHRRALRARLTPIMENPEHRGDYKHPQILEYVKTHRADLVAACLLITKAYLDAGSPDVGLAPLGSFESWSKLVRNPLVWLGLEDPVKAQSQLRKDADIGRTAKEDFVECLDNLFHAQNFTARQVMDVIEGQSQATQADAQTLRDVLSMLHVDEPTIRDINSLFRALQDRPLNGLLLRRGKRSKDGQLFRISIPM